MAGKHKKITWEVDKNGCWNCTSHTLDKDGYPRYKINGKCTRIHRIMYEKYNSEIPEGLWVLHKCDNPTCINPEHLYVGTAQDNTNDMVQRNRNVTCPGEKHGNSKLTEEQVIKIINSSLNSTELSKEYGIPRRYVGAIQRGEKWEYLFKQNKVQKVNRQQKLSDIQILEIRSMKGLNERKIAKLFNISFQYVNEIINNKTRAKVHA